MRQRAAEHHRGRGLELRDGGRGARLRRDRQILQRGTVSVAAPRARSIRCSSRVFER